MGYETVQRETGTLPLLAPMSEVAGRMAAQVGAHFLEKERGGKGILLRRARCPARPRRRARRRQRRAGTPSIEYGMEAEVLLLDKNLDRLRWVDQIHQGPHHDAGPATASRSSGRWRTPTW